MQDGTPVLADLPPRVILHVPPFSGWTQKSGSSLTYRIIQHVWQYVTYTCLFIKSFFWKKRIAPGALPFIDLDYPDRLQEQDEDYEICEELEDAISPLYDQLQARASWHLLEWVPQRIKKAKAILQKAEDGNSYQWE